MSLKLNPNTKQITIPRGDTGKFKMTFIPDGIPYEMSSGDVIEFQLKRSHESAETLFTKSFTTNPFIVTILPTDTANLAFGNYEYSLKFIAANEGEEDTLYELQPGDIVRFAVKKEPTDDEPLLVKILDGYDLHLNPQDTIGLDFINYYYDVYITFADYNRDTYITEGRLRIAKEQHRKWRL